MGAKPKASERKTAARQQQSVRRVLHYKVVELATVDESALESTLNEWTRQGWNFDSLQLAMRESSKRPSMAFVFFSREVAVGDSDADVATPVRAASEARKHLTRLAQSDASSAWERAEALASSRVP